MAIRSTTKSSVQIGPRIQPALVAVLDSLAQENGITRNAMGTRLIEKSLEFYSVRSKRKKDVEDKDPFS